MKIYPLKPLSNVVDYFDKVEKQTKYATMQTINDMLFGIKNNSLEKFQTIFDKPNMSFLKSSFDIKKATKDEMFGTIAISQTPKTKGASPMDVLGHQINPSMRENRRFEKLMRRGGFMGANMYAVPSRSAGSDVVDQYGGISGKFARWIISYLGQYQGAGFKANMTDKKKSRVHKIGKSSSGYRKINGVMYFISAGKQGFSGKRSHLTAGIWKKTGTNGANLEPVILFFNAKKSYGKRFDFEKIAEDYVGKNYESTFDANFQKAMATAR